MTAREIMLAQIQLLLPIAGATFAVTLLCLAIFNVGVVLLSDVLLLIPFTLLCVVALAILYSEKTLTKRAMFVRYLVHFIFVLLSATLLLLHLGWISFELSYLAIALPLQATAYVAVGIFDKFGSRRTAFELNKGLDKYHKSHPAKDKETP